ncbi:hypothetical protein AWR38_11900 [Idiomarina sp. WRN-38]|nr:hypothetical protein AUR68_11885 [Idiomarina sp. H105]OAF09572.1 hypothetical protein AWR38_11900 [Idiomarina sp. WRN-38]|tara:strand:- start:7277 stop:7489 length:213 start_codon:yes stop_codon:yes gene_type:complete
MLLSFLAMLLLPALCFLVFFDERLVFLTTLSALLLIAAYIWISVRPVLAAIDSLKPMASDDIARYVYTGR